MRSENPIFNILTIFVKSHMLFVPSFRYEHNIDDFKRKVTESIKISKALLYDPTENLDSHAIR